MVSPNMQLPEKSPWNRYRRWRSMLLATILVFVLIAILLPDFRLGKWGAGILIVPGFVAVHFLQFFKCPRCRENFFYKGTWEPWVARCRHCGLPKWKDADHVDPDFEQTAFRAPSIREMAVDASISDLERNTKFLLLVLRDDPGAIHLKVDANGWADVRDLLTRSNRYGFKLTPGMIDDVLAASSVRYLEWDKSGNRIRASGT